MHASVVERSITTDCKSVAFGLRRFESCPTHHKRTKRLFQSQKVGRAKRVPLISPHFSKRIRSPAFGGTNCFFAKKEVRAKDFFGSNLFYKKVAIQCNFFHISRVLYPLFPPFEPMFLLLLITRYFFLQRLFFG